MRQKIYSILLLLLSVWKANKTNAQSPLFRDMVGQLRHTFSGTTNPNPGINFFYDLSPHETDSAFFRTVSYDTSNVNI